MYFVQLLILITVILIYIKILILQVSYCLVLKTEF